MKKFLLGLILIVHCSLYGQEFVATGVAFNFNNEGWSGYTDCEVPISFNMEKNFVLISSEEPVMFDIKNIDRSEVDGDKVVIFYCVDESNDRCAIWLTEVGTLFVFYPNFSVGYIVH